MRSDALICLCYRLTKQLKKTGDEFIKGLFDVQRTLKLGENGNFELPPSCDREDFQALCDSYNLESLEAILIIHDLVCEVGKYICFSAPLKKFLEDAKEAKDAEEAKENEEAEEDEEEGGATDLRKQTKIEIHVGSLNSDCKTDKNVPWLCGLVFNCLEIDEELLAKVFVPSCRYSEYKDDSLVCIVNKGIFSEFHSQEDEMPKCYFLSYNLNGKRLQRNQVRKLPNTLIVRSDSSNETKPRCLKAITEDIRCRNDEMQEIVSNKIRIARETAKNVSEAEAILSMMIAEYKRHCPDANTLADVSCIKKLCNNDYIWVLFFAFMYYYRNCLEGWDNNTENSDRKTLNIDPKEWCKKMLDFFMERDERFQAKIKRIKPDSLFVGGKLDHTQSNTAIILAVGFDLLKKYRFSEKQKEPNKESKLLKKLARNLLVYINDCEHEHYGRFKSSLDTLYQQLKSMQKENGKIKKKDCIFNLREHLELRRKCPEEYEFLVDRCRYNLKDADYMWKNYQEQEEVFTNAKGKKTERNNLPLSPQIRAHVPISTLIAHCPQSDINLRHRDSKPTRQDRQ